MNIQSSSTDIAQNLIKLKIISKTIGFYVKILTTQK